MNYKFNSKLNLKEEEPRIYLNVSYAQKEEIKSCGGKWDVQKKHWYIYPSNEHCESLKIKFEAEHVRLNDKPNKNLKEVECDDIEKQDINPLDAGIKMTERDYKTELEVALRRIAQLEASLPPKQEFVEEPKVSEEDLNNFFDILELEEVPKKEKKSKTNKSSFVPRDKPFKWNDPNNKWIYIKDDTKLNGYSTILKQDMNPNDIVLDGPNDPRIKPSNYVYDGNRD